LLQLTAQQLLWCCCVDVLAKITNAPNAQHTEPQPTMLASKDQH
jgi:hypothetical protein